MRYPDHINQLIALFKKFSGIGAKSAERIAFELIKWPEASIDELCRVIGQTKSKLAYCKECGALTQTTCSYCERKEPFLCVVSSIRDVFLIEQTRQFFGAYHVLGKFLYPFEEKQISDHATMGLKERIQKRGFTEVILALDSTIEGDTTSLFLKKELSTLPVKVSRLAFGLPMGSSFDFIDGGTLTRALAGRQAY